MAKPRIVIQKCDVLNRMRDMTLPPADAARVREITLADETDLVFAIEPERLQTEIADADFLITENMPLTADLIARAARLKLIQTGGLRHEAIDIAAARAAGIPVAAAALPLDICVAEHAILLMLALGKKLLTADRAARSGEGRGPMAPVVTSSILSCLYGKTLGIIGLGEIGRFVARRARAFDMRILYSSRVRYGEQLEAELGIEYRPLEQLLAESDFVDIHATRTPATLGMIGERELALMKPSAFLVNVARADIVDEKALLRALAERRIAGAGLDVYWQEPLSADHPLTRLDNVILTPHVAGRGGVAFATLETLFGNIRRLLRGEGAIGVVS